MSTFLTAEEVAERLRVTADTVRHYLRRKELIGVNRGGRTGWRIALEDYNRFVERRAADTDTPPPGCRVITISNQKGGVGKTTTTANVGYALAERGRRVLLVDVDPQANLTLGLGAAAAAEDRNIVNIFRHEDRGLSSSIVETKTPNLHLVPSHIDRKSVV